MAIGLRVRDETGNIILDYTTRVGKFIGTYQTNGASTGSFTDTRLIGKQFFYFITNPSGQIGGVVAASNTLTGVVNWSYPVTASGVAPPSATSDIMYYGYY